ncbi:hypothetical protein BOX15_Mlig030673g3 [Macrostomum lignano]|uniref:Uncharacterized protein n=1 Tax=Macrostomum lignano TaxID=282301 RepID=A0A267DBB3_9PLAT|nr:hypothetical protein BOX15_Mlig030673g3 [Macrostomum lignano]
MSENVSLMVSAQPKLPEGQQPQQPQQQQQQQQPLSSAQKPRPLGRVRVQGQRANGQPRKSEDFSVQGEAFSAVEKQQSSSTGSLPPITSGQQTPQHQRQSSIQSTSSSSPTSDAFRLTRLQQREQELLKKLQDAAAREKLLKEQVDKLEKMLGTAQKLLDDERKARQGVEAQLADSSDSGDKYRLLYEEECRAHQATAQRIEQLQELHREETARLMQQLDSVKDQLKQTESRHEDELAKLHREHQQALSDRDKRIDNLKRQVAGALGTNSHERQSQIDQLNKELQKMVNEVETLRRRTGGGGCQQCPTKDAALQDQGEQIRQLGAICQRFRGQLSEQEQMLIMLLGSKTSTRAAGVSKAKQ